MTGVLVRYAEVTQLGSDVPAGIRSTRIAEKVINLAEVPEGNVLVAIQAAAVNFPDLLMTAGQYQFKPPAPFCPGLEAAGIIISVGKDVQEFKTGDKVICQMQLGAYATHAIVPSHACLFLPAAWSFEEGAAGLVAYTTAFHGLVECAKLQAGETVLIHGATGGVGLAAVQMAKLLGATVIATGSSDEKLAVVKSLGADHIINYSKTPVFHPKVKDLTKGEGVDVVYDPVGGDATIQSIRSASYGARIVLIGHAGGKHAQLPATHILIKGLIIMGARAGAILRRYPEMRAPRMAQLMRWINAGQLRPYISHRLPLDQGQSAMQLLWDRKVVGKVVISTTATTSRL